MHDTDLTAERGMSLAQQRVLDAGHIFRRQQESDFGIDAQIEIKESAKATGRLIAAQIKAGPSYFKDGNDAEFWHYVSARHRDLWLNHSLPVILILCDLERGTCHYALVSEETCVKAGERWKVRVPKSSLISADSAVELASIASPIVAASDFSIMAEHDQSHGLARRISLDIVVHPGPKPINKPLLGAIIRAGLKHGQSSRYFRDEIARKTHENRPVDVVCGFVYLRGGRSRVGLVGLPFPVDIERPVHPLAAPRVPWRTGRQRAAD
ncbi:MAG: DUF4365 domain-containing protein [Proteobacteria bacterium]|nr:DUF4365 domain-containing protein [Pseudomonadota bacterium]